jgi:hypothetical protein
LDQQIIDTSVYAYHYLFITTHILLAEREWRRILHMGATDLDDGLL